MAEKRLSLRAAMRAYSERPETRGRGVKDPMHPRRRVLPPARMVFQVTKRGLWGEGVGVEPGGRVASGPKCQNRR